MPTQYRIATALTLFSLLALVFSPLSFGRAEAAGNGGVSIAISSGSQLTLVERDAGPTLAMSPGGARNLLCNHVYRLHVADIGVQCVDATLAGADGHAFASLNPH